MKDQAYKIGAPPYVREFLDYMSTIKGRSKNTINSYYEDIKLFLRFLKMKNKLVDKDTSFEDIEVFDFPEEYVKKVSLYDALEFLHFMADERNNVSKARARRAVALRQFFEYLTDNKLWFSISPLQKLKLPSAKKALPKHLTVEQSITVLSDAAKLVKSAESENKSDITNFFAARDYCILTLFLNCGMRLSELVGLNVSDYKITKDLNSDTEISTLKVTGKGSKERLIYLNNACVEAYNIYIKWRERLSEANKILKHEKALFLSMQYKRISNRRVQQIVENLLKKNNLDGMGISVHKLRHTAATLMYQNGVDVRILKEILGHENLDTTQIYTHVANEQIKKAMDKNPLADLSSIDKK